MAQFIIGEYIYETHPSSQYKTVSVKVHDISKSSYEDIPQSVTYQGDTYYVTDATNCFYKCTSLVQAPVIPNSVTDMFNCFFRCTSLTQAPVIPDGVTNMEWCFAYCTSLTTAPVIPDSVTNIKNCFRGCTSLVGDAYILGNPLTDGVFKDTMLPITVYTFNQTVANSSKLSASNNNVTIQTESSQGDVPITILGTRTLTEEENITYGTDVGIRIDLLADCTDGVALTNIYINNVAYSNVLYDMDNNLIPLNSKSAPLYIPPDYLRCYIIINAPQIVPDKRLNLFIGKVAFMKTNAEDKKVAYPSTATPSQVKQEGQSNLISPQIDIFNISFNPETTKLNEYTIGSLIGVARLDVIRAQTNDLHNQYPIKHIVTHANNVKVSDTQTLQDWITEQYSEFL